MLTKIIADGGPTAGSMCPQGAGISWAELDHMAWRLVYGDQYIDYNRQVELDLHIRECLPCRERVLSTARAIVGALPLEKQQKAWACVEQYVRVNDEGYICQKNDLVDRFMLDGYVDALMLKDRMSYLRDQDEVEQHLGICYECRRYVIHLIKDRIQLIADIDPELLVNMKEQFGFKWGYDADAFKTTIIEDLQQELKKLEQLTLLS